MEKGKIENGVLPRRSDKVKLITPALFETIAQLAGKTPRGRMNFNFHPDDQSNPHRFLNVMLRGTYICPHRHLHPPKAETFLVLQGAVSFFLFGESGKVESIHSLGAVDGISGPERRGPVGIDIAPGLWHTLIVMEEPAVCFEVKPGPYDASADKEFAPWAPREGASGVAQYLAGLESLAKGAD